MYVRVFSANPHITFILDTPFPVQFAGIHNVIMGGSNPGLSKQPIFYIKIRVTFMSLGDAHSDIRTVTSCVYTNIIILYLTCTIVLLFYLHFYNFFFFFAGALSKSQFPVFTIYAQKTCLGIKPCERAWCFDRVQGYKLKGFSKKKQPATSRQDCLELCLGERDFSCR